MLPEKLTIGFPLQVSHPLFPSQLIPRRRAKRRVYLIHIIIGFHILDPEGQNRPFPEGGGDPKWYW